MFVYSTEHPQILGTITPLHEKKKLTLFLVQTCISSTTRKFLESLMGCYPKTTANQSGSPLDVPIPVVDLKGGFRHWRAKHVRNFLGCHAHFGHAGSPN